MDKETILSYIYCILPILISVLLLTIPLLIYSMIAKRIMRFYETKRASGFRSDPAMMCLVIILVISLCIAGTYGVWALIESITTEPEVGIIAIIVPIHMQIMEEVEMFTTVFYVGISAGSLAVLALCEMEWRKENKKKEERPLET